MLGQIITNGYSLSIEEAVNENIEITSTVKSQEYMYSMRG